MPNDLTAGHGVVAPEEGNVCVSSTLRSAIDRGYECITVADATACESGIFGSVATAGEVCAGLAELRAA